MKACITPLTLKHSRLCKSYVAQLWALRWLRGALAAAMLVLAAVDVSAAERYFKVIGATISSVTDAPLWDARVRVLTPDGVIVKEFTADKQVAYIANIAYNIGVDSVQTGYVFEISCPGYKPATLTAPTAGRRVRLVNLGLVRLRPDPRWRPEKEADDSTRHLDEVTVVATKVKMVMSGDTVVFNADAFDLADGSMLDALIKRLPGAELRSNGEIYVNGHKMTSLLVNGDDFFKGNPRVALDNLPAYTVNTVKVYAQEDYPGQYPDGAEKPMVMDVRLKKEYNQGLITNVEAGYGTEDRYLGRLFALLYRDRRRLAVVGNINNTNDTRTPGENDTWNPNWQAAGRAVNRTAGLNYSDRVMNMKLRIYSDLTVSHETSDLAFDRNAERYMDGGTMFTRASRGARDKQFRVGFNTMLRYMDAQLLWDLRPELKFNRQRSRYSASSQTDDSDDYSDLINSMTDRGGSLTRDLDASIWGRLGITPRGWADELGFYMRHEYERRRYESLSEYHLDFVRNPGAGGDFRMPRVFQPQDRFKTYDELSYSIKGIQAGGVNITNAWSAGIEYGHTTGSRDYFRLEEYADSLARRGSILSADAPLPSAIAARSAGDPLPDINESYNSRLSQTTYSFGTTLWAGFDDSPILNGLDVTFSPTVYFDRNTLHYDRYGRSFFVRRTKWRPGIALQLAGKGFFFNYDLTLKSPDLADMVDITDNSDPLYVYLGNPGLKYERTDRLSLSYRAGKWGAPSTGNFEIVYTRRNRAIARSASYDLATGITTYRPANIDGNWSLNGSAEGNFRFGPMRRLTLNNRLAADYLNSVDIINTQLSTVRNLLLSERLKFEGALGHDLSLGINGSAAWRHSASRMAGFATINAVDFDYGLTFTAARLPWEMSFTTDIAMHSRRGYGAHDLNTDHLVWNARVTKSLLQGRLMLALDGFDILGQLSNVRLELDAQGRTETRYNTLPRYAMLHAVWRFTVAPPKR